MHYATRLLLMGLLALTLAACGQADSDGTWDFDAKHKIVIQSSNGDAAMHDLALTIAANLQKHYGMDNVEIEVVAYAGGIGIMTADSEVSARVKSLSAQNVKFSACNNTLKFIEGQQGARPELTQGVKVVDDGVVRISELQEQGYSLIYPK